MSHDCIILEYKYKGSSTDNIPLPIMHALSLTQQNQILSMLDAGHSTSHIAYSTGYCIGTISRLRSKHHSHLSKPVGGHLSSANIHHAVHLLGSGKASTAVDVAKIISNINKQ